MKLKTVGCLFFFALYLLFIGGTGTVEGIRYRSPRPITFQELVNERPTSGWFRVTGGIVWIPGAAFVHLRSEAPDETARQEVYCPVKDARLLTGKTKDLIDYVPVILQSKDLALLSKIQNLRHLNSEEFEKTPVSELYIAGDITAMIASGTHELNYEANKALMSGMPGADVNSIVLISGDHPSVLASFGIFIGGLLLGVGSWRFLAQHGQTRRGASWR